jgi:hypothetical protein
MTRAIPSPWRLAVVPSLYRGGTEPLLVNGENGAIYLFSYTRDRSHRSQVYLPFPAWRKEGAGEERWVGKDKKPDTDAAQICAAGELHEYIGAYITQRPPPPQPHRAQRGAGITETLPE